MEGYTCRYEGCGRPARVFSVGSRTVVGPFCDQHTLEYDSWSYCASSTCVRWASPPSFTCALHGGADYLGGGPSGQVEVEIAYCRCGKPTMPGSRYCHVGPNLCQAEEKLCFVGSCDQKALGHFCLHHGRLWAFRGTVEEFLAGCVPAEIG